MRHKFTLQTRQRICERMAKQSLETMTNEELAEFYISVTTLDLKKESFDGLVELARRRGCYHIIEEELK